MEEKNKNIIVCLNNLRDSIQMAEKIKAENGTYQIINELDIYSMLYDLLWLFSEDLQKCDGSRNIDNLKKSIKEATGFPYDYADIEPIEYLFAKFESPEYKQANPLKKDELLAQYIDYVNYTMIQDPGPKGYRDYSDLVTYNVFTQSAKIKEVQGKLQKGKAYVDMLEKNGILRSRIKLAYDGRVSLYTNYPFGLENFFAELLRSYGLDVDKSSANVLYDAVSNCYINELQNYFRDTNIYPLFVKKESNQVTKRKKICLSRFTSRIRHLFGDDFLVRFNNYDIELACDAAFQLSKYRILSVLNNCTRSPGIIILPPGFLNVELIFDMKYKDKIEGMIENDDIYEENYMYVKDSIEMSRKSMEELLQNINVIK